MVQKFGIKSNEFNVVKICTLVVVAVLQDTAATISVIIITAVIGVMFTISSSDKILRIGKIQSYDHPFTNSTS
jgi:UPF0716 family protein affecting phage T7 exclusion